MKKLILLIFYSFVVVAAFAQTADDDYKTLSALSSDQLMKEGRDYFEKREAGKALSRFLIVADRYQDSDNREQKELCVRALNNAGCVYKYLYYDYPQAYEYFMRAYTLCEEIGYNSFLPAILVNLGDLLNDYGITYNSSSVLEEAAKLFDDCFKMAMETKNWELLTTSFFNLSNLNYDIDLSKYKGIFSSEIPADTPDIEFVRLQYQGIKNLQENKYANARQSFERQLDFITTQWEASRDTICVYMNIAETYKKEKDYRSQAKYLQLSLNKANSEDLLDLEVDIARQLAECYDQLGDREQYAKYHDFYLEKREEMHDARLASIGELKYISDLQREEANARKATLKSRLLLVIVIALGVVLLIIIMATVLIWRNNNKLKSTNHSLYEKYNLLLQTEKKGKEEKYARSNLDDAKKEKLIERIKKEVMDNPEQICREDFTLKELAQLVDSNTTYVSQVLNETYGLSFSTLLGNYRVKLVCNRLNEGSQYDNFTIEGIANSVGFKSRSAFINAFKREVGLTPSQYIKMADAEREKIKK